MRDRLKYEVLLNCILIQEDVRPCFFFWCKKTLKITNFINKFFPNLILNKYEGSNKLLQLESSDVLLISKRIIQREEYDTDAKLGKLLGYKSADNFVNLDKNKTYYNYVMVANEINLFNELSQNKLYYEDIRNKVELAFRRNNIDYNVKVVERIILKK